MMSLSSYHLRHRCEYQPSTPQCEEEEEEEEDEEEEFEIPKTASASRPPSYARAI